MSLLDDLVQVLQAYVAGQLYRREAESWLASHTQENADANEAELSRVFGRGYGQLEEADVRAELAAFLGGVELRVETPAASAGTASCAQTLRGTPAAPAFAWRFVVAPIGTHFDAR